MAAGGGSESCRLRTGVPAEDLRTGRRRSSPHASPRLKGFPDAATEAMFSRTQVQLPVVNGFGTARIGSVCRLCERLAAGFRQMINL